MSRSPSERPALILLFLGLPVWLFALSHGIAGDAAVRYWDLLGVLGFDEPHESPYSRVGPMFASPLVILGLMFEHPVEFVSRFNVLVASAFAAGVWHLESRTRRAGVAHLSEVSGFLVGLGLGMLPKHLQGFYGEVFSACCVVFGILAVYRYAWKPGWAFLVLGAVNTPALLVPLGFLCAWDTILRRRGRGIYPRFVVWTPILALLAAFILYAAENALRSGSVASSYAVGWSGMPAIAPFQTALIPSTMGVWFEHPPDVGLWDLLFSPGKGVMWFCPGLWLLLFRDRDGYGTHRREIAALTVFFVGMLAVYAPWSCWHGDWYWGPRYFLIASFLSALLVWREILRLEWIDVYSSPAPTGRRFLVTLLLLASTYVGVSGAVAGVHGMDLCQRKSMGFLCWYVPDYSALRLPWVAGVDLGPGELVVAGYQLALLGFLLWKTWRGARWVSVRSWVRTIIEP